MKILALCLALAVFPAVLLAQPNCTQLGFNNILPTSGIQLPRCVSDQQQCCTANYIEGVETKVTEKLKEFLAEEFDEVIEDYLDDIQNLVDYFTEDFPEDLLLQLPGAIFVNRSDPALRQVIQELIDNYEIPDGDNFNSRRFLNSLLNSLHEEVVRQFVSSSSGQQCIRRVLNSGINQNVVNNIATQIQEVRRSITTLKRIGYFLERERRRLQNVTPLQQCINAFVERAFCSRCVRTTPPLCLNTCNALVRGCYSPYYTALNRNYDQLWRVVRNILSVVNSTVQDILTSESAIIDIGSLTADIFSECGLSVSGPDSGRRRRDDNTNGMNENTGGTNSTNINGTDHGDVGRDGDVTMTRVNDGNGGVNDTSDETGGTREQSKHGSGGDISRNYTRTREDTTGDTDSSLRAREMDVMFIPFDIVNDAVALTGAFQYGRRGLLLCLDALVEERGPCYIETIHNASTYTLTIVPHSISVKCIVEASTQFPHTQNLKCSVSKGTVLTGMLPFTNANVVADFFPAPENIFEMDNSNSFCSNDDFCTARCNCWDGEAVRRNDTENFDLNDIEDQDQNPVLDISQQELQNQASAIGDAVAAFLASEEFTSVAPSGAQEEHSSSAKVIVSITTVLLSSLMALL